jgi:hypothetical protein
MRWLDRIVFSSWCNPLLGFIAFATGVQVNDLPELLTS